MIAVGKLGMGRCLPDRRTWSDTSNYAIRTSRSPCAPEDVVVSGLRVPTRLRANLVVLALHVVILAAAAGIAYLRITHSTRGLALLGLTLLAAVVAVDAAGFAVLAVLGVVLTQ